MILIFPDSDTFRLVLTGGFLPAEVLAAPTDVSTDSHGRLFVATTAKLPKKTATDLTRLGVTASKQHAAEPMAVSCWPQILPLVREPGIPTITSQTPILFEVPNTTELTAIVGEMMRLGNDRQSFRWISDPAHPESPRVLLRVIGPPYYTLLRALDRLTPGFVAYVEQAPRVWVELGYTHPFGKLFQLPESEVLLLRHPQTWEYLSDGPFQDVYEILRFDLPDSPIAWEPAALEEKLHVPLRLVPGNATDSADLWVLRENAESQLDTFVRDADERILARLKFAVGTGSNGDRVIILRTLPSKQPPPVLPMPDLVSFRPFWKLPNLYIPVGVRLHPTLRRDAVRKLLADDPDRLVWLNPDSQGGFTPETIPESAFQPLEDWVDYIIETHSEPLQEWIESSRFEFEPFICSDKPPSPPKDGDRPAKQTTSIRSIEAPPQPSEPPGREQKRTPPPESVAATPLPVAPRPKSEWELQRKALEEQFLAVEGGLDNPVRQALWPELATANAGFGDVPEAAICWVNALWEADHSDHPWLADWVRAEQADSGTLEPETALFQQLKLADPTPGQIRQTAALFLLVAARTPVPRQIREQLPTLRQHFVAHEHKLPIRLGWLVGSRLARLSGADVLGLARVRDRILQRLLEFGLNAERDLPLFLRTAGLQDSERIRKVLESVTELHRLCRHWTERGSKNSPTGVPDSGATLGYLDLLFAYALAKLGATTQAQALELSARNTFDGVKGEDRTIVCDFLYQAFHERITQAQHGQSAMGAYSPAVQARLDEILTRGAPTSTDVTSPYRLASYAIARMREQSRILEPQEKFDPYAIYQTQSDELQKTLAGLPRERDPAVITRKLRDLYTKGITGRTAGESRFLVLLEGLPLASRVGESFSAELLGLVPDVMAGLPVSAKAITDFSRKQGRLLERALFLAAHFDRRDILQQLADQFITLLRGRTEDHRYELINIVAGQCLRSLRKLGLRDEIDRLLHRLQAEVLRGESLTQMKARYKAKPEGWWKALQTLLNLAGGWLSFGLADQAHPILEEARNELLTPIRGKSTAEHSQQAQYYTRLAMAYVAALGHGPVEDGLARIVELFQRADPARVTYSFTTVQFYSRLHLNLIEEVVQSVVSDEFALGPVARRWLDEDEYLIRRRIHRDMKSALAKSEL